MNAYIRMTDLSTGTVEWVACFSNSDTREQLVKRRVIQRAESMYENAVKMGLKEANYAFYLQYSWKLETGKLMLVTA
jgi:hypothetical protein